MIELFIGFCILGLVGFGKVLGTKSEWQFEENEKLVDLVAGTFILKDA